MRVVVVIFLFSLICILPWSSSSSLYFSYDDSSSHGPSHWSQLDAGCGGDSQSPIEIPVSRACNLYKDNVFEDGDCTLEDIQFFITSHNLQGVYGDYCTLPLLRMPTSNESYFQLVSFHIHIGAEHVLLGRSTTGESSSMTTAELHLVHQDSTSDRLAVVGVLLQATTRQENHAGFETLLSQWKIYAQETEQQCGNGQRQIIRATSHRLEEKAAFSIYQSMIPPKTSFYHYNGSLTTPPCSELVYWYVASQWISISMNQMVALKSLLLNYRDPDSCVVGGTAALSPNGGTNRPIQARNGRPIVHICPLSHKQRHPVIVRLAVLVVGGTVLYLIVLCGPTSGRQRTTHFINQVETEIIGLD